jgi:hypothetical protein
MAGARFRCANDARRRDARLGSLTCNCLVASTSQRAGRGVSDIISPAPRGVIPNWQPSTTIDDYLHNCREGLEEYLEGRAAKLFGLPSIELQRWKLMAELPEGLFERLFAHGVRSTKALSNVALAFGRGQNGAEVERCPHCGEVLRTRWQVGNVVRAAIKAWLDEGTP